MSRALFDVNVLIALLDADHVHHLAAQAWLDAHLDEGWASCALTENGFVRVVSQPRYPGTVSPRDAVQALGAARRTGRHEFWACDLSLLDVGYVDATRLHGPRQVTDAYLLALAVHHGGRLVTFDRSIPLAAVPGATESHLLVL